MRGSTTNWTRSCGGTSRSRRRLKRKRRRRGPRAVDMAGITVAAMSCCEMGPCSSRTWDMLRRAGGMGVDARGGLRASRRRFRESPARATFGRGRTRRPTQSKDAMRRTWRGLRTTVSRRAGGVSEAVPVRGRRAPDRISRSRFSSFATSSFHSEPARGRGVGRARATIPGRDPRAVARAPRRRTARVGTPSARRGRPPRARRRSCF